jgi:uncharacterized membrane protein (UPF0127 family)
MMFRPGFVFRLLIVLAGLAVAPVWANDRLQLCVAATAPRPGMAHDLTVEIARTPEERRLGLMERRFLGPKHGMLFVFREDRPASSGFWMYRTLIPLDIAYLDRTGTIVAIRNMTPCPPQKGTNCPSYEPGAGYRYALEVNGGYFAERDIAVGARVWASGDAGCALTPRHKTPINLP